MEGEDDIEFLPYLDFFGRPELLVRPLEVGGKIRAQCRQSDLVLDPADWRLQTGAPVLSLLAQVRFRGEIDKLCSSKSQSAKSKS